MDDKKKLEAKILVKKVIQYLPLAEQISVLESLGKDIRRENSIRINNLVRK